MLLNDFIDHSRTTKDIWIRLACESKFNLIEKLKKIEKKEVGYGTIIVPPDGFSYDEMTHNLVVDWLDNKDINVISVENEIKMLEESLNCKI